MRPPLIAGAAVLHLASMPKRSSRPHPDENVAALEAVARLTGSGAPERKKNPAAVALGSLGGRKGGKARAAKLTAQRRQEIARKAAKARWEKQKPPSE